MPTKVILVNSPAGFWRVYHRPIPGFTYGIGGDSASGIPGRHGSAAHVINFNYHRVDAVGSGVIAPEAFAQVLYEAGTWYNNALIAVEAMFHGLLVNYRLMDELGYPNLFQHDNTFTSTRVRLSSDVGWKQTEQNRNLLLSLLQTDLAYIGSGEPKLKAQGLICQDAETLKECSHFQRNPKGKPEAEQGFADDRVISCGIGNALFHANRRSLSVPEKEKLETEWEKWEKLKAKEQALDSFAFGEFQIEDLGRM